MNTACSKCNSASIKKNGYHKGIQRYRCNSCGYSWIDTQNYRHTDTKHIDSKTNNSDIIYNDKQLHDITNIQTPDSGLRKLTDTQTQSYNIKNDNVLHDIKDSRHTDTSIADTQTQSYNIKNGNVLHDIKDARHTDTSIADTQNYILNDYHKDPVSYQIALQSGKFEWQNNYLRPRLDSGIAELFGHSNDHNRQAYIKPANDIDTKALVIGGSEYTLKELTDKLNIELDNYMYNNTKINVDKSIISNKRINRFYDNIISINQIDDKLLKYWTNHKIDNPKKILHQLGFRFGRITKGKYRGNNAFYFLLNKGSKYLSIDNNYDVTANMYEPDSKSEIFPSLSFDNKEKDILIVEGIADLVKARELGYNAFTSTGGVSEIKRIISNFNNRNVYICIDTDEPSQKELSLITQKSIKCNNNTFVIDLPLEPEKGKDLCDYFINGKSKKDFGKLIKHAKRIELEKLNIDQDIQITEDIYQSHKNYYYKLKASNKEVIEKPISNFIFEISNIIIDENGNHYRQFKLINTKGKKAILQADSDFMSSLEKCRNKCVSLGCYYLKGMSINDLLSIFEFVDNMPNKKIKQFNRIGYITEKDMWVFPEKAYYNRKTYDSDKNGIINIGKSGVIVNNDFDFFTGYKQSISNNKISINKIIEYFTNLIGNENNYSGLLGLGFLVASFYSDVIFKKYRQFPFLYLKGKSKSGKTTYGNLLMNCLGFDIEGSNFSETTQNYIMKTLETLSNIPYWLDEYEETKSKTNSNFMRGIYNRAISGKGTKVGTTNYKVNGTLILSGEYIPSRESVYNRCVFIDFPNSESRQERNIDAYNNLTEIKNDLSYFLEYCIVNRNKETEKRMIDTIDKLYKIFKDKVKDSKLSLIYAIMTAGISLIKDLDNDFIGWITEYINKEKSKLDNQDIITQFFFDISSLVNRKPDNKKFISIGKDNEDNLILKLKYMEMYDLIAQEKHNNYIPKNVLFDYIEKSDFFKGKNKTAWINKKREKCLILYYDRLSNDIKDVLNEDVINCEDE